MSDSNRVIIGGFTHVIGGWGKYRIEAHKANYDINKNDKNYDDIIKFYGLDNKLIKSVSSQYIIKCIIDDKKVIKQIKKLLEIVKKYEKKAVKNIKNSVFSIILTSNDIEYIICNSNMCDLYVLKSLYEDLIKINNSMCNKKLECVNLPIIDPYDNTINVSDDDFIEELLKIEEKNEKYITRIENFHVKIIETIEHIILHQK